MPHQPAIIVSNLIWFLNSSASDRTNHEANLDNLENPELTDRPWYLYVIECKGNRLYTGITVDVAARFAAHSNETGAKFTKSFPPQRILFSAVFEDRPAASKAEYDFKKLSADEKRHFIASHTSEGK
ncbi:MAG: GIY-YIG nuclease family protein [Rhodobiaceae bacterium]|nr:GIY-YIG nuclease family protein [Rhodobiaceae bacterium]